MSVNSDNEITIKGSYGEGGGQIVRSSMALSAITGRDIHIYRVRAGRSKPGLKRQHLTAVRAVAEICDGELEGDQLQSAELRFRPGSVTPGEYRFSVGSAGSAMLVLQTVLPPLLTSGGPSTIHVEGGTHNDWAPSFDFIDRVYLPLIRRMGPDVTATLNDYGFYPAGGGRVTVQINPVPALSGFDLTESGRVQRQVVRAVSSGLPADVGERETQRVVRRLNWRAEEENLSVPSAGPGNFLCAEIHCQHITELFSAVGRKGVRAEKVADSVTRQVNTWKKWGAPVGEYLADQLILPFALSAAMHGSTEARGIRRGGTFVTGPLSEHAKTQIWLLHRFLKLRMEVNEHDGRVTLTFEPPDPSID